MKTRCCDNCFKGIKEKTEFITLNKIFWQGNTMKNKKVGDMCMDCFNEITAAEAQRRDALQEQNSNYMHDVAGSIK